ncbi:hypothetical protein VPH35_118148 [Triticum aestivum]
MRGRETRKERREKERGKSSRRCVGRRRRARWRGWAGPGGWRRLDPLLDREPSLRLRHFPLFLSPPPPLLTSPSNVGRRRPPHTSPSWLLSSSPAPWLCSEEDRRCQVDEDDEVTVGEGKAKSSDSSPPLFSYSPPPLFSYSPAPPLSSTCSSSRPQVEVGWGLASHPYAAFQIMQVYAWSAY